MCSLWSLWHTCVCLGAGGAPSQRGGNRIVGIVFMGFVLQHRCAVICVWWVWEQRRPFQTEVTLVGQSISRTKLTVPTLNSGKAFVVTYYFVCVALSQLRDALKFLLQEGEACPGPVPREESYVSVYSVSTCIRFLASEVSFYVVSICRRFIPFSL